MGRILEHWRITIATVFSIMLIVGAYFFAQSIESPSTAEASAETALLQAIAAKDSDNDGLPDWEESLYGTNPNNSDSNSLGMTDGEAVAKGLIIPKAITDIKMATSSPSSFPDGSVPSAAEEGSITDTFAKNFFTLYVATRQANGGEDLTKDQISNLVAQSINQLSSGISPSPDFKSEKDIKVSGTGPDAMLEYAIQAEDVFKVHGAQLPKSEMQYLQDAVQDNDTSAPDAISEIAASYRNVATGLSALAVPEELSETHLLLINSLARLGQISSDFSRINTDPIAAMLSLKQYMPAIMSLSQAFTDIWNVYNSEGIVLSAGVPGASFVNVIKSVGASTKQP